MRNKTLIAVMIVTVLSVLLIATPKPVTAQFVLSAWDHPDEYGQGIEGFLIYENSTGSWVAWDDPVTEDPEYYIYDDAAAHYFEWTVSVFIKLRVVTWLNSTLLGLTGEEAHHSDGVPYFRHNITVTSLGETIWSKSNFTYVLGSSEFTPMWLYQYDVILNFEPREGYIYTVTITYEVYY